MHVLTENSPQIQTAACSTSQMPFLCVVRQCVRILQQHSLCTNTTCTHAIIFIMTATYCPVILMMTIHISLVFVHIQFDSVNVLTIGFKYSESFSAILSTAVHQLVSISRIFNMSCPTYHSKLVM